MSKALVSVEQDPFERLLKKLQKDIQKTIQKDPQKDTQEYFRLLILLSETMTNLKYTQELCKQNFKL